MSGSIHATGNVIEAALWIAVGASVLAGTLVRGKNQLKATGLTAAIAFVVFGLSDIVEARTGAWWRPWWLLAWKAACLIVLLGTLLQYRVAKKMPSADPDQKKEPARHRHDVNTRNSTML